MALSNGACSGSTSTAATITLNGNSMLTVDGAFNFDGSKCQMQGDGSSSVQFTANDSAMLSTISSANVKATVVAGGKGTVKLTGITTVEGSLQVQASATVQVEGTTSSNKDVTVEGTATLTITSTGKVFFFTFLHHFIVNSLLYSFLQKDKHQLLLVQRSML